MRIPDRPPESNKYFGDAHRAVCEWSKANGYRLAGPHWEIYGDPDPSTDNFDVEVFWSLVAPVTPGQSPP
jgi:effector-binding domain-containing protein